MTSPSPHPLQPYVNAALAVVWLAIRDELLALHPAEEGVIEPGRRAAHAAADASSVAPTAAQRCPGATFPACVTPVPLPAVESAAGRPGDSLPLGSSGHIFEEVTR